MSKRRRHLSEAQLAANRANALKSTGPRTPEGKLRSSMNSWKHGITANRLLLTVESEPDFERMLHDFRYRFQPADGYELKLVDSIIVIQWHMDRLRLMESCLIQCEIHRPGMTGEISNVSDVLFPALAFKYLSDKSNVLVLLNTQLNRLSREHARLHETFLKMRREHPPISPANPEFEPSSADQPQPQTPPSEQDLQNEPVPCEPAAISSLRSITFSTMPFTRPLVRAA